MPHDGFDLAASARAEMIHEGFDPDFPAGVDAQLANIRNRSVAAPDASIKDLRSLLWSSIDNNTSRDLDQIEYAERTAAGIRLLIGIADVDSDVDRGSPIDKHASDQTTSVYTAVRIFPMLPEELSTGLTSLNENEDRATVVIEMLVAADGSVGQSNIYRALVRNKAQLAYESVGPWLEGSAPPPPKLAASQDLQAQLRLQDETAAALGEKRHELGALDFDRSEPFAVVANGQVQDVTASHKNRATAIIEDFMVAANGAMARTLSAAQVSAIRRVVKTPVRWPRIVELAKQYGTTLPAEADSIALSAFLQARKQADPVHFDDLSLTIIKLMGPGEYVLLRPGDPVLGHFGLAAHDYTHSTAPNRRFADLVTQRLIKAVLAKKPTPYSDQELDAIAQNCTDKEDAARKVERTMNKRMGAVALQHRIGQNFAAVVTGVTPKGVFVRVPNPPVEGMLVRGEHGVDVGDELRVTLVATDPRRGYIDFARA